MANPQRENGHIDIANEIMDHLIKIRIPGEERQIFDVIMRQTWGYCELKNGKPYKDKDGNWVKKKFDYISNTQFEKFTGIKRRKIWNIINKLLDKNLIIKKSDSSICKYGIQKDWEKWKVSPKKVTVIKNGDRVSPNMVTEVSPIMVHTKENIQKKKYKRKISQLSFGESDEIYQLTLYFEEKIRENNQAIKKGNEPQLQRWCKDMDRLIRLDGANPDEIKRIIDFVVKDEFWDENILCPASLRKHYPRLWKKIIDKGENQIKNSKDKVKNIEERLKNMSRLQEEEKGGENL